MAFIPPSIIVVKNMRATNKLEPGEEDRLFSNNDDFQDTSNYDSLYSHNDSENVKQSECCDITFIVASIITKLPTSGSARYFRSFVCATTKIRWRQVRVLSQGSLTGII